MPGDFVFGCSSIERLPEVFVFYLLFPAARFPGVNPFDDALPKVFGIGEQLHFARFLQSRQRFDRSLQFHPIVRRGQSASDEFLFPRAILENRSPPARTWIAKARAICVDDNSLHVREANLR